jgi:hypothetical protein
MVPSLDALPDMRAWTPDDAKLSWKYAKDGKDFKFVVRGFGGTLHCAGWLDAVAENDASAGQGDEEGETGGGEVPSDGKESEVGVKKPTKRAFGVPKMPKLQKMLGRAPRPRLPPSAADPSALVGQQLDTEDDVLHVRHLPDFRGNLRAADAELLLQALLHPYLRVPLVLRFFAEPSRTAALACTELQDVLDAALFEPGAWQPDTPKAMPTKIPAPDRSHLATPCGLLFQELTHSPSVLLDSVVALLDNAVESDVGRYNGSGSSAVILYMCRLALRVESFARYILSPEADKVRGLATPASARVREVLRAGTTALRARLEEQMLPILLGWYSRLRRDGQMRDAAMITSHLAFAFGSLIEGGMRLDERSLFVLLSSRVFVNVHHDFEIEPEAGAHASKARKRAPESLAPRIGYEPLDVFDLWQVPALAVTWGDGSVWDSMPS